MKSKSQFTDYFAAQRDFHSFNETVIASEAIPKREYMHKAIICFENCLIGFVLRYAM